MWVEFVSRQEDVNITLQLILLETKVYKYFTDIKLNPIIYERVDPSINIQPYCTVENQLSFSAIYSN